MKFGRPGLDGAVRTAYTYKAVYTLPKGDTKERDVTEHLLIGYEGSGGE
jgi:hypothetical protein